MKKILPILITTAAIAFYSCQKELQDGTINPPPVDVDNSNLVDSMQGNWNFIEINAETESSSEFSLEGSTRKTLAFMDYNTQNNHGTISIDDSVIHAIGLTYSISSTIKTYTYIDGVLNDSNENRVNIVFPETESITPYKAVGPDSIFFPKGGFTDIAGSRVITKPSAAKIILEGNTLSFKQDIFADTTQNIVV